jgi:hypothetical protein
MLALLPAGLTSAAGAWASPNGGNMRTSASLKFLAGLLPIAVLTASRFAVAAAPPAPGVYAVSSYVVSANATNGGLCGAPQGYYLESHFYYPGPSRNGAVERHSLNGPAGNQIQELDFPTTPAANLTAWSGDYTATTYPGGSPALTATFSTALTFVDADSFLATTTYVYAVGTNSICTTVFQNTYIRTGKIPHRKPSE